MHKAGFLTWKKSLKKGSPWPTFCSIIYACRSGEHRDVVIRDVLITSRPTVCVCVQVYACVCVRVSVFVQVFMCVKEILLCGSM